MSCFYIPIHTPADEEVYAEVTILREDHQHQKIVKIETFYQQPIVIGPNTVLHQDLGHTAAGHHLRGFMVGLVLLPSISLNQDIVGDVCIFASLKKRRFCDIVCVYKTWIPGR